MALRTHLERVIRLDTAGQLTWVKDMSVSCSAYADGLILSLS